MSDEFGWNAGERLLAEVHRMLLRLAGRLPDEMLPALRALLGTGDLRYLPDAVSVATVQYAVPVTPADKELLDRILILLDVPGDEPQLFDRVPVAEQPPAPGPFRFLPVPPEVAARAADRIPERLDLTNGEAELPLTDLPTDLAYLEDLARELTDQVDVRAVDYLSIEEGVRGVWRTWRLPVDGTDPGRRVYLVELDSAVPAWEVTYELQKELTDQGERAPQVESFWTGEPLGGYHRAALAGAALLMASDNGRVRLALTGEQLTALVRAEAARVPVEDRPALADRLAAGVPVPGRFDPLPDLVEPGRGTVVPGGHRTDGRRVWPEALGYYLTGYGVAPPRDLLDELTGDDGSRAVDQVALFRAGLALTVGY
ncbi:hypothetical protein [Plantactinospora sonchi]|uniref:Uncharacterized protein n=1 Tax=Plantactinospora sonchi TaxID=1544735 RepID=A0ABU7S315_9ACTN